MFIDLFKVGLTHSQFPFLGEIAKPELIIIRSHRSSIGYTSNINFEGVKMNQTNHSKSLGINGDGNIFWKLAQNKDMTTYPCMDGRSYFLTQYDACTSEMSISIFPMKH